MLDSDDIWLPNHLEDCIRFINEAKSDGIYGSLIIRNVKTGSDHLSMVRELCDNESMINYLLKTGYGAQTSTLFTTAESTKDILWDSELARHQDYDFVVRYSEKYSLSAKIEPTVVYQISNNTPCIDFNSCIKFINRNRRDVDSELYNNYNFNMLMLANRLNSSENIISHYRKESTRYKEFIPYNKYISIRDPQTKWQHVKCKLEYLKRIIKIVVK